MYRSGNGNSGLDPHMRENVRAVIRELFQEEQQGQAIQAMMEEALPGNGITEHDISSLLQPLANTSITENAEQDSVETRPNSANGRPSRSSLKQPWRRANVSPSANSASYDAPDSTTGSLTPKVAVGNPSAIANSNNKENQVQGSEEETMEDDSLICSWEQAMISNPLDIESLNPLLQTTMAAKVQEYRMRVAASFGAAVSATISTGANSSGCLRTNSPSGN